ncbi:hypothetical protein GGR54DRAFT_604869 [Hypoxylon sp. NC1633]|nr:hypothetical protein GGR54DRAFT_604869 [Hypoxylon sp. NC1633]
MPSPPIRLVATAPVWPPIPAALLRGNRRWRQLQPSGTSLPTRKEKQRRGPRPVIKHPPLFQQLFPDEAKQHDGQFPKSTRTSPLFGEPSSLTPLTVEADEHHDLPPTNTTTSTASTSTPDPKPVATPLRPQAMLILSAASKHLHESDFMRLARRGAHVEGWVSGIQRAVQARDPDTLAPLGHYFLLFDSSAAATAYRDAVCRLWNLAKTHVPGAHHSAQARRRVVPLPRGLLHTPSTTSGNGREGGGLEAVDVAEAIAEFTLVPPSQRLELEESTTRTRAQLEDLDLGGGEEGSFVDALAARTGTKHMVLVTVDGGRVSLDTLRRAIEDDGVDRNLAWRVTDLENGILPFGKSIVKSRDRSFEQNLLDQAGRAVSKGAGNGDGGRGRGEEDHGVGRGEETSARRGNRPGTTDDGTYRRYPRFIVPFTDNAEAQRFVRSWHRRQFNLRMSTEERGKEVLWDESRIFNASVLW